MKNQPLAISIMGPTASGKTALALELAKHLPIEIISVDSALIYKGMDIGTAKPTKKELEEVPHHLIDIVDPVEVYSAGDFRQDCLQIMQEITAKNKIPVLAGGTMMYFKSLIDGISDLPNSDPTIRENIQTDAKLYGWESLHQKLVEIDPISAAKIHPNDPQRLMRALEVFEISGKTLSELQAIKPDPLPYNLIQFAIYPEDRSILHTRIEDRFKIMLENGFEEEVKKLKQQNNLDLSLPSMRSVGYRQMWEYLDGTLNYDEMVFRGIVATRQLAKRQLTWLKNWDNLNKLDSLNSMHKNIEIILNLFNKNKKEIYC